MATTEELQAKARQYWQQMKNLLVQQLQPGNRRTPPIGIDRWKFGEAGRMQTPPAGFSLPSGRMPSDADVSRYIEYTGGNPYHKQLNELAAQAPPQGAAAPTPPANGGPGGPSTPSAFDQLMTAAQGKLDEANAANIKRYDEGHGELSGLRGRNQDRVQNWGKAATADIEERLQEALLDSEASLAARGLSGSTIQPAFEMRKKRDVANELQRISEMRDSRASEYDTRDTNNLVGFVERREDTGPDFGMLLNLAMQHGQNQEQLKAAQADRKFRERLLKQQQALRGTGGRGIGVPGPQGGVAPMWGGPNPVQLAGMMGMLPGILAGPRPAMMQPQQAQQQPTQDYAAAQAPVAPRKPTDRVPMVAPGMGLAGVAATMLGGMAPVKLPTPGAWAAANAEYLKRKKKAKQA